MGGDKAGVRVMLWWEYRGTGLWVEDPGDKAEWVGGQGGWEILEAGWAVCGELGNEAVVSNAHFTNTLSGCGFLSQVVQLVTLV